jgi:dinuclear metal center YbgI/SA1388 family protein
MILSEIVRILEQIAPTHGAESWDNVGLLAGDPQQTVSRILLTIDYTAEVAAEAKRLGCELVISYHPPIFQPIKRLTSPSLIFDAIRNGIAIYSPHTALDVADGGTNDVLADAIGIIDRQPLRATSGQAGGYKLVVFVPENALEQVSQAIFDAGSGVIGNYRCCSFRSPGTGTFFGNEQSNPSIGQAGKLEEAAEFRLETVVPIGKVDAVIKAMRGAHPYEEPAFDLLQLAAPPTGLGQGRVGPLENPIARSALLERIKKALGLDHLLVAGPREGTVNRAAVGAGACGEFLDDAIAAKADLFLTGEVRHHDALKAAAAGMTVVCTLHSNSERGVLKRLKERITAAAVSISIEISKVDHDPFIIG